MIRTKQYKTIALGGTFDHFHAGHKDFLNFAASLADKVIIGVTEQHMSLKKPFAETIQPEYKRKQAVSRYCAEHNINGHIITISDAFGPTLDKKLKIQALACTTDTVAGADKINEVRDKMHLFELPVHIHKLKMDQENSGPISAARIRSGEINRDGVVYGTILKDTITLSEKMRTFFGNLHGEIVSEPTEITNLYDFEPLRIVVGDTSLETFIRENWEYDLGVYDFLRQRESVIVPILEKITPNATAENDSGSIQQAAVSALNGLIKKLQSSRTKQHLQIDGEEDLLAVAATLLLPLGSYIYYGYPNKGMVECAVTEQLKTQFFEVLAQK